MSTINANWNSLRTTLTLTADIDGASSVFIQAGYTPNFYSFEGKNTLELTGLEHADGNPLYVRAVGLDSAGEELVETEVFTTLPIPHPILGIVKDCEKDRNIVDIVEIKNGRPTPRYQSGQRVVRIGVEYVHFWLDDTMTDEYMVQKVCKGGTVTEPEPPTNKGACEFAYWLKQYEPEVEPEEPVMLNVIFNYDESNRDFTIAKVKKGDKIQPPTPPEPPVGCKFYGWYKQ